MEMNERIKLVREEAGLSRKDFGERIGVSGDTINNLERGRAKITEPIIRLICSEFDINKVWLETGEGEKGAPELDELGELVAMVLEKGANDPDFDDTLSFMREYMKLNKKNKKVINDLIDVLLNAKKDPE